ncbi:MAG: poly(A) polymerase [Bdellovibrionales bacterium]|nr:poly(A) polymerase [Bdellovibrionales bacterium]
MSKTSKPQLNRNWIDRRAIEIVSRLQERGYTTYLVGGCVRDLLAGFNPKDYDIATSALPEEVRKCVPKSYVIGKRFRLVLVKRGPDQFEVATFRRDPQPEERDESEHPLADNIFGTPEEDANRRDFTINGLFYDPINDEILDFVEGLHDIKLATLRMIGDPRVRLKEDPIRILRGLRLASKLRFRIEPELRCAMHDLAPEICNSVLPRKREEFLKILKLKEPGRVLVEAFDLRILEYCCPSLDQLFKDKNKKEVFLNYLDRIRDWVDDPHSPTELFSVMVVAFSVASGLVSWNEPIRQGTLLADENLKSFMKDQLGMFISEMTEICHAIEIASRLNDVDSFKKRGIRRQSAFVRQHGFILAMKMAELEHLIEPHARKFWRSLT